MAVASKSVTGLISIAPAPHGNLPGSQEPTHADRAIVFDDEMTRKFFCNAPRFPKDAIDQYR
jgi:hypothetical protein